MAYDGKNIATRTAAWAAQKQRIELPRALLGGTPTMQAAGEKYLPTMPDENKDEYKVRLQGAVLDNHFKRTGEYLTGQVFQKPVKFVEPQEGGAVAYDRAFFDAWAEDVDREGTNASMKFKGLFVNGVYDGVCFIYTDMPPADIVREGNALYVRDGERLIPKTAEYDAKNRLTPYLVLITAAQVLGLEFDIVGGKRVPVDFRYEDSKTDIIDGKEQVTRIVWHYTPGTWEKWEAVGDATEYDLVSSGNTGLDFIPLDWFMPGEHVKSEGSKTAIPALQDLAYTNAAHWRGQADHNFLMMYVRRPPWFGVGIMPPEPGKPIPLHPGVILNAEGLGAADFKSVGIDSSSVEKSMQDLDRIESSMALYGLQLIVPPTGNVTATQTAIAAAASDSTLKGWVQLLIDTVENILRKVAIYRGGTDGPAVSINSEFRLAFDPNLIKTLEPFFSKETMREVIRLMGILPDDFSEEAEQKRIAAQQQADVQYTPSFGSFAPPEGE